MAIETKNRPAGRPSVDLSESWNKSEKAGWAENLHAWIIAVREAMQGITQFKLPENFLVENKEQLIVKLPQKTTVPLKTVNILERRRPRLRRYATGSSHKPQARRTSSNIETWVNAVCDEVIPWGALVGKTFLEGACAVTALPSVLSWEKKPSLLDTIDKRKYDRLDEDKQTGYRASKDQPGRYEKVDESGKPLPKKTYQRDAKGRTVDDAWFKKPGLKKKRVFKLDRDKSRKAYMKDRQAWLAHRLPFQVRVLAATEAIPTFGPGERLEQLVTREKFTEEELLDRDFFWTDKKDQSVTQETPSGEGGSPALVTTGDEGTVTLYTRWYYNRAAEPCVEYQVEGYSKCYFLEDGDQSKAQKACLNLAEECGFSELPAKWVWGLHLESDNPTVKGIPFLKPTLAALTTAEAFLTFKTIHAYRHSFTSWAIEANPEIVRMKPEVFLNSNKPVSYDIEPMKALIMPGKPHALQPPNVGNDANDIIQVLLQTSTSQSPSDIASGGGAASSGHDRSLSRDFLETSMNQVLAGCLDAYVFLAERIMESACWITEEYDVLVPVYANVKVPQQRGAPNKKEKTKEVIELDPAWLSENYGLEGYYPKMGAEDIAMITVLAQLYKEGVLTFYEFRERALGDESPEDAQIATWIDQNLKTDEGRAAILERQTALYGEELEAEQQKLVDRGLMTKGGMPTAALAPEIPENSLVPVGGPAPPAPPGSMGQSPMVGAPSSLTMPNEITGGIVAGASEMAALQNDAASRTDMGLGIGQTPMP